MPTVLANQQADEPAPDILVNLEELIGGVAGPKVIAPTSEHGIQVFDHLSNVFDPAAGSAVG
jgi:hypothetical protein